MEANDNVPRKNICQWVFRSLWSIVRTSAWVSWIEGEMQYNRLKAF